MEGVVSGVIFDFYGTLAHWADADANYGNVFEAHGYTLERSVADAYFARYDGVEHGEHSVDEESYEAWVRSRLRQLTKDGGVPDEHAEAVIEALRQLDQGAMVAYPEAAPTLAALREAGLTVGVCSNWGWELNAYLDEVGLLHLVDAQHHLGPCRIAQAASRHLRQGRRRARGRPGRRPLRRRFLGA